MNSELCHSETGKIETVSLQPDAYEAPAIESVLTPESLEREVHYAGMQTGSTVTIA